MISFCDCVLYMSTDVWGWVERLGGCGGVVLVLGCASYCHIGAHAMALACLW